MGEDRAVSPWAPGRLGLHRLRNRIIKAAAYEGMSPGGVASAQLRGHHEAIARGGAAMTTVAYGAVHPDGRTFGEQLCVRDEVVPGLRDLTDAVHGAGAKVSLQLAHCGFFSKLRRADGGAPRGPSRSLNRYGAAAGLPVAPALTVTEIERIPGQFADAAERAVAAGFDAVEVHLGHGYLLSQFLSPATNRRRDRYGGSPQARMQLPLSVVRAVIERVGDSAAVLAKINTEDGFAGGATIDDGVVLGRALDAAGIDGIVTSGGSTSRNPLFLLRGQRPLRAMIAVERNRLQRVALRVLGPAVLKTYPFEEMFFRPAGQRLLEAVSCPVILLGGVVSLDNVDTAIADGFSFVQMGRALIADPDLPLRFERGEATRTRCNACNECIATMDDGGVRCVL